MASLTYFPLVPLFCHIILFLIATYPPNILSQNPSSSSPFTAPCSSSLLPLLPCAPFVQGTAQTPGPQCCSNLKQLYSQEPHCLCLLLNGTTITSFLLNGTTITSFPFNRTLALQIPVLCTLQVNNSACPGEQIHLPPTSPDSQVSFGTWNNSTVAASPAFSVPPRPGMMGLGFGRSEAMNLKAKNGLIVVMTITTILFTLVPY